jgi:manganese efflux pump family protein
MNEGENRSMNPVTTFILAIGLAADAFAVSVSSGLSIKNLRLNKILKISLFFGIFQGFMPLIGWLIAINFRDWIVNIDHWIAFGLLTFLGIKAIRESLKDDDREPFNPLDLQTLVALSIATSIDALAVGISFAVLQDPIVPIAATIGIVTFLLCCLGVWIGHRFGKMSAAKVEILGGAILIAIGSKILFEHLTAA